MAKTPERVAKDFNAWSEGGKRKNIVSNSIRMLSSKIPGHTKKIDMC